MQLQGHFQYSSNLPRRTQDFSKGVLKSAKKKSTNPPDPPINCLFREGGGGKIRNFSFIIGKGGIGRG